MSVDHGAHCACPHHAPVPRSVLASLLPALSCAVCPACMALWKPLLSVLGVTLAFNDAEHAWVLYGSLTIALVVAGWDFWRSKVSMPFWLTVAGATLMVLSHLAGDLAWLEWAGVFTMAASVPWRMTLRARHAHAHAR